MIIRIYRASLQKTIFSTTNRDTKGFFFGDTLYMKFNITFTKKIIKGIFIQNCELKCKGCHKSVRQLGAVGIRPYHQGAGQTHYKRLAQPKARITLMELLSCQNGGGA